MDKTKRLAESAILIAIGTVLSFIKFESFWVKGGSITLASTLPLVLMSYRYGVKWGAFSAFVYSLIQALLGAQNFGYAPTFIVWVGILLFDYILPFTGIGMSSLFKNISSNKRISIIISIFITYFFRFACHTFSGWIVWGSIYQNVGWEAFTFSFGYNGAYMLPEFIISALVVAISYKSIEKYWQSCIVK